MDRYSRAAPRGPSDKENGSQMETMIPAWVDGTLRPVEKLAVHRRGLRHKAVSVFVMRGSQTLIQRRALTKYHTPGLWANACCTHPFWDEAAEDCAPRRLQQELGIECLPIRHRGQVHYRADVGGGLTEDEVVEIFTAEASEDTVCVPNPAEVAEVAWIDLDALVTDTTRRPERYTPWLRIYLRDHINDIFAA
ncbi:isopentenyl-diphosphate delta-isomerase [Primorskyibacter flagellatus]|uniref:Isopentenyl-diphosphate Delta-isomerase n=2 Tax=Primorskyibacter flagellatus TaxID=1387277 RepID=A0A1W2AKP6_9RHOB|nr:isopentenyl-diphosphate delta-isomerase [Primorskyibacter flagellatus]